MPKPARPYDAVMFDLLTALLDSWSVWNRAAGSADAGLKWRRKYLELTYDAGPYRPYESIVREAAILSGVGTQAADNLLTLWDTISPWPEVADVVGVLAQRVPLAVATNCSIGLGRKAAARVGVPFQAVVTAEEAGYYKPRPEPYVQALALLGTEPARTLFVAGSAADVPGASGVGMPVYWHNRMGLSPVGDARPDFTHGSLGPLRDLIS